MKLLAPENYQLHEKKQIIFKMSEVCECIASFAYIFFSVLGVLPWAPHPRHTLCTKLHAQP